MSADERLIVFKVGGSLLSLPDLPQRLEWLLEQFPTERRLLIVGGGQAADIIRHWQTVHALADEAAHWLALRAMSLNEALLQQLLPNTVIVGNRDEMHSAWQGGFIPILSAEHLMRAEEREGNHPLPHDWSATSDSIAAWVTVHLNGQSLILLKSVDLPPGTGLADAALAELVDEHFPLAAASLSVSWSNVQRNGQNLMDWMQGAPSSG